MPADENQAKVERPPAAQVWRAIEIYLGAAYPGSPPAAVQSRLGALRSASHEAFYECAVFEPDRSESPTRFSLRLGNRFYPNMKLVIELRPDAGGYLFRADTHDRHGCPARDNPDYEAFRSLIVKNEEIAQEIESRWVAEGFPTFKAWLRDDLARRWEAEA